MFNDINDDRIHFWNHGGPVTVNVDIIGEVTLQEFLTGLNGGELVDYMATGPVGHPNVTVKFKTMEEATAWLVRTEEG